MRHYAFQIRIDTVLKDLHPRLFAIEEALLYTKKDHPQLVFVFPVR